MSLARGEHALHRLLVDGASVLGEALPESLAPLILGDLRQLVKTAELVERAVLVAEQIAHQMLDAAGEQASHPRRGMECLAQPPGDLLGLAVGAAGQFLKLVDEQDQLPVVALGDPLGPCEGDAQLLEWVAASARRLERDSTASPSSDFMRSTAVSDRPLSAPEPRLRVRSISRLTAERLASVSRPRASASEAAFVSLIG